MMFRKTDPILIPNKRQRIVDQQPRAYGTFDEIQLDPCRGIDFSEGWFDYPTNTRRVNPSYSRVDGNEAGCSYSGSGPGNHGVLEEIPLAEAETASYTSSCASAAAATTPGKGCPTPDILREVDDYSSESSENEETGWTFVPCRGPGQQGGQLGQLVQSSHPSWGDFLPPHGQSVRGSDIACSWCGCCLTGIRSVRLAWSRNTNTPVAEREDDRQQPEQLGFVSRHPSVDEDSLLHLSITKKFGPESSETSGDLECDQ